MARSELFPALVMVVLAQAERDEVLFGDRFFRQTVFSRETALDLNYTVFDSGARAGRIEAAKFEALAANFAFNDTHCNVIYQVERAYAVCRTPSDRRTPPEQAWRMRARCSSRPLRIA